MIKGAGLDCMDGHLGVNISYTDTCELAFNEKQNCPGATIGACPFLPAISDGAANVLSGDASLQSGFTIEAWLRGDPNDDSTSYRVIASLSAECPFMPASAQPDQDCKLGRESDSVSEAGTSITFRLLQTPGGCVAVEFKTPDNGATKTCLKAPRILRLAQGANCSA